MPSTSPRWGALGSDDEDRAIEHCSDPEAEPVADLLSGSARGLPTGARTVEAWVRTHAPGARPLRCGGCRVELAERAILAGGHRFALAPGDRRELCDGRWHRVVVTYDGTELRAYLDGTPVGEPQAAELTTDTSGTFAAAEPTTTPAPPAVTPAPAGKPTLSFRGSAKKLKLGRRGRRGRFTLRFTATPGLRATFTVTAGRKGAMNTLKGRFTADRKVP